MRGRCFDLKQGIYVHIPFCLSKCPYCSFNSYPTAEGVPDWYLEALLMDVSMEARLWEGTDFSSVYVGGGTPSLLEPSQMGPLFKAIQGSYSVATDAEITLECNPSSLDAAKLSALRDIGVTRLSVGIQSLNEADLKLLGRLHGPSQAIEALRNAERMGFASISADVIVGIPGQTLESLARTIHTVSCHVTHLSIYMLSPEPGTPFEDWVSRGVVSMPDDDALIRLYNSAASMLASLGLARYEISNFSRPGCECIHNRVYWQRGSYTGLGAGSHSHRRGVRYSRTASPWEYARLMAGRKSPVDFSEALTDEQTLLEEVMLGLRTADGIDLERIAGKCGIVVDEINVCLDDLVAEGYLAKEGNRVKISPKGIAVGDAISLLVSSACGTAHLPVKPNA